MKDDFQRQFPPQYQGRPDTSKINDLNMQESIQNGWFNGTSPQVRGTMLHNANSYSLPPKFDEFICQELMVTMSQAQDFIYEYRRFIFLQSICNARCYPSEPVEKVWLIHMGYGKNYIKFCDHVAKRVFYHLPYTGDTTGEQDQDNYESTLRFYSSVFL